MAKFRVGDNVSWKSQSQGNWKTKRGVIYSIVIAGATPYNYGYKANGGYAGNPRNHESYVVMVGNKTYWPRVSHLHRLGGG
jgi:hypothetical protein